MASSPITINGNLTADPELKFSEGGNAKLSFGVAVSYYWNDQDGKRQEKTSFFNVVAWRQLADDAAAILSKGMRVVVSGRLEQRSYVDKEGNNRSIIEIVAEEIGASVRGLSSVERKQSTGNATSGQRQQKPVARAATNRVQTEEEEPF